MGKNTRRRDSSMGAHYAVNIQRTKPGKGKKKPLLQILEGEMLK